MSRAVSHRSRRLALPPVALLAATLALGGCLGRKGPETTGSLGRRASNPETARLDADALGARYDQKPGDAATGLAYARALKANGQQAQALAVLQQTAIRNPTHSD